MGSNGLKLASTNKKQKTTDMIENDSSDDSSDEDSDSSDDSSDEDEKELHKVFLAYSFEVQPAIARKEVVVIR